MNKKIITRFAPSPTGNLHIGGVRTALFNYLFTRKNDGQYLLRIDDTDVLRSKKEYEDNIISSFKLLGLNWDNKELIRQSERLAIYRKYLQKLIDENKAYISKEENIQEGERAEVIRLRNKNADIVFSDLIRGEVKFNTTELGDFVIAKSLDEPIYHFASVVDDYEMSITHVIRAEEHLSNTPRQILIQEAIGAPRPIYAHIPIILAPDRSKLSKRHGAMALTDYLNMGYLPEAIINYLAFLGWNPGTEQEIYSLENLIKDFDIEKVQKSGAIFNIEKLNWYNKQYLNNLSASNFIESAKKFLPNWLAEDQSQLSRLMSILRDRCYFLSQLGGLFEKNGELAFIQSANDYQANSLLWKKNPSIEMTLAHLKFVKEILSKINQNEFRADIIKSALWSYAEEKGRGDVLWPLRMALTGQEKSPDPFVCAEILGPTETIARIDKACAILEKK